MKNIKTVLAVLLAAAGLVSCQEKAEENITPVFPEQEDVTVLTEDLGKDLTFSFEANMDWTLVSDRQWLRFKDEIGEVSSLSGKAGSHTVTYIVSGDSQSFEPETANVEMTMGGKSQVVLAVSRTPVERELHMYTYDNGEIREVTEIGFPFDENSMMYFGFEANFDWKLLSYPEEWIAGNPDNVTGEDRLKSFAGTAGEKAVFENMELFSVDYTARYRDLEGQFVVSDLSGEHTFPFTVKAAGVPEKTLEWIDYRSLQNGITWNSRGQRTVSQNGSTSVTDEPAVISFLVKDHNYHVRIVTTEDGRTFDDTARPGDEGLWVDVKDDGNGNISVSAQPNETDTERTAYVFVFPNDYISEDVGIASGPFYKGYFSSGEFAFKKDGYGVALVQESMPGGFEVMNGATIQQVDVEIKAVDDPSQMIEALGLTVTDNIYEATFTAETWGGSGTRAIIPKNNTVSPEMGTVKLWVYDGSNYVNIQLGGDEMKEWFTSYSLYSYDSGSTRRFAFSIGSGRTAFDSLPAGKQLIIVFYGEPAEGSEYGDEIGTFVIKH